MNKAIKNKSKKNKGFTLVEILVVVLIIGIIAAIVVTEYKKVVLKSQYATLLPLAKSLHDSQEMLDLSRGYYAKDFSELELPNGDSMSGQTATVNGNTFSIGNNNKHIYIKATKAGMNNNHIMYQSKSKYFPGEIHCEAKTGSILANWLCKVALKGKQVSGANAGRSLTEGYTDYVINGVENGFFPINHVNVIGNPNGVITLQTGDGCIGTEDSACRYLNISDGSCYAEASKACFRSTYSNSYCEGTKRLGCAEGSKFYDSSCLGTGSAACNGGEFYNSSCEGKNDLACASSTYDNSVCIGNSSSACGGSRFKKGSICYAYVEGACGDVSNIHGTHNSTYEDTSCCIGHCPDYAPKCDCAIDSNTGQHALSC